MKEGYTILCFVKTGYIPEASPERISTRLPNSWQISGDSLLRKDLQVWCNRHWVAQWSTDEQLVSNCRSPFRESSWELFKVTFSNQLILSTPYTPPVEKILKPTNYIYAIYTTCKTNYINLIRFFITFKTSRIIRLLGLFN